MNQKSEHHEGNVNLVNLIGRFASIKIGYDSKPTVIIYLIYLPTVIMLRESETELRIKTIVWKEHLLLIKSLYLNQKILVTNCQPKTDFECNANYFTNYRNTPDDF